MTSNPTHEEARMEEDIKTNHIGGTVQLDDYAGSDLNLRGWELTQVIDDVLLVEYADGDAQNKLSGGIFVPTAVSQAVWRIGKVILNGNNTTVKAGQFVMFPNDKGLKAKNVNGRKEVVFLSEERIFGVCQPVAE